MQWTRLPGGEADPVFCRRVATLLGGAAVAPPPAPRDEVRRPAAATPSAPPSEGRQLVAKVQALLNKASLARPDLEIADGYCQRAATLDSSDAAVWAAWSQVDSWYVYHTLDDSPARREGARTKAARALQLDPDSYDARLAQACHLARSAGHWGSPLYAAEAENILRTLREEQPGEPRALLVRGILQRNAGDIAGARATWTELAANPEFAALAWNEIGWAELLVGHDYRAAEMLADRSIALEACWPNLVLKEILAQLWRGDLDAALSAIERLPTAVRMEDHGVTSACFAFYYRREPENILRVLGGVGRDWLRSNSYNGPKAWWAALAHEMAGRQESARLMAQTAVQPGRAASGRTARLGRSPEMEGTTPDPTGATAGGGKDPATRKRIGRIRSQPEHSHR